MGTIPMHRQWYYRKGSKAFGPVSSRTLKRLVKDGEIASITPVRLATAKRWTTAGHIKGLIPKKTADTESYDSAQAFAETLPVKELPFGLAETTDFAGESGAVSPLETHHHAVVNKRWIILTGGMVISLILIVVAVLLSGSLFNSPSSPNGRGIADRRREPSTSDLYRGEIVRAQHDAGAISTDVASENTVSNDSGAKSNTRFEVDLNSAPNSPGESAEATEVNESPVELKQPMGNLLSEAPKDADPVKVEDLPLEADKPLATAEREFDFSADRNAKLVEMKDHISDRFAELNLINVEREDASNEFQRVGKVYNNAVNELRPIRIMLAEKQQSRFNQKRKFGGLYVDTPTLDREIKELLLQEAQLSRQAQELESELEKSEIVLKDSERKLSVLNPTINKSLREWIYLCYPLGHLPTAIRQHDELWANKNLIEDSHCVPSYILRGFAHFYLGNFEPATQDFSDAGEEYSPLQQLALCMRAAALHRQGKMRDATRIFSNKSATRGFTSELLTLRGACFLHDGDYSKAEREFRRATGIDETYYPAQEHLARVLSGRPATTNAAKKFAIDTATKACNESGWADWVCIDSLAMAYANSGNFEAAIGHLEQAMFIAPRESRVELQERMALYKANMPFRFAEAD